MAFAVVLEGVIFVSFVVMLCSGVQKRMSGCKVLVTLLGLVGGVQCVAMALIVGFTSCCWLTVLVEGS